MAEREREQATPLADSRGQPAGLALDGLVGAIASDPAQLRLLQAAGLVAGLEVRGTAGGWLLLEATDAQSPIGTLLEVRRQRDGSDTLLTTIGATPRPGSRQLGQAGRQAIAVQPGDQLRFVARIPNGQRQPLQGTSLETSSTDRGWSSLQLRYQDGRDGQPNDLVLRASLQPTAPDWLTPPAAPQRESAWPVLALNTGDQLTFTVDPLAGSPALYGFLRVEAGADGSWFAINDRTGARAAFADTAAFRAFVRQALDPGFSDGHLYTLNQGLASLPPLAAAPGPGLALEPTSPARPAGQGLQILTSDNRAALATSQARWIALEVQGGRVSRGATLLLTRIAADGTVQSLGSLGGLADGQGHLSYGGRLALELPAGSRLELALADPNGSTTPLATAALALGTPATSSFDAVRIRLEAGHDRAYTSLVVQATALEERPAWATAAADPQRQGQGALLAVQQGETLTFSLSTSAAMRNRYGFVRVERRSDGTLEAIRDSDGSRMAFANSADFRSFLKAALADSFSFQANPASSTSVSWTVQGPSGTYAPVLLSEAGEVFVGEAGANRDGRRHILALGDGAFAFEDLAADQRSDWDYNDALLRLSDRRWTVTGANGLYAPVQLNSNGDMLLVGSAANSDRLQHINLIGQNTFVFEQTQAIDCSNWDFADGVLQISSYTPASGDLQISGTVQAGPVFAGVTVEVYGADGVLLGRTAINDDGTYLIRVNSRADYRGPLLLRVLDSNDAEANFRDETSGSSRSLNTELRALGAAQDGMGQFQTQGRHVSVVINVSPLTELTARHVGLEGTTPPSTEQIQTAEAVVARAFGLEGVALSGVAGVTTNSTGFDGRDGLNPGEKIGLVLAKLSGLDNLNGGNLALSLNQLARGLGSTGLDSTAAALVDQGRARALEALRSAGNPFKANDSDADVNTSLNRQLLGEVLVTDQQLDPQGYLTVVGTALPDSIVTITFPDGSSASTKTDQDGRYRISSTSRQTGLRQAIQVLASDGVAAPVALTAPAPPLITGAGRGGHSGSYGALVVGQGAPGTTITLRDANGTVLASAIPVAADGSWQVSLSPAQASGLHDGTPLEAIATDRLGIASAASSGAINNNLLLAALPEAEDGFLNATERASDSNGDGLGDTPIQITVPASAQPGQRIVTILTRPNGTTLTLSTTLSEADLRNGAVEQLIPAAALSLDGLWSSRTSLLQANGNPAGPEPSQRRFRLDTLPPAPPLLDPTNGSVVSGQAEAGATVTVLAADGSVLGTAVADSQGHWSLIPLSPLAQGSVVTAQATDPAGNRSTTATPQAVNRDIPLISGVMDNRGSQQGLLNDGSASDDATPELVGSLASPLASGQQLAVYRQNPDGSESFVGYALCSGTAWRLQDPDPLPDGAYAYSARLEAGGRSLSSSAPFNLLLDTTAPGAPQVQIPEAALGISGPEASDGVELVVRLPRSAALGDQLITRVTAPDGSVLTLTSLLSAADLAAGQVVQTIPADRLLPEGSTRLDGLWNTSSTIRDSAGNSSTAPPQGFRLAATPPSLALEPLGPGNRVNGEAALGVCGKTA